MLLFGSDIINSIDHGLNNFLILSAGFREILGEPKAVASF